MAATDKEQLCGSLLKWLQTCKVGGRQKSVEDVSDGVAIAEVLAQIAPEWFNSSWMAKIKTDVGSNWRLKVSNLKKILKGVLDYYQECLGQQIVDFTLPDVGKIGEHHDETEMGRLLQLVLGCAVNCDHKQDYIEKIMSMEESLQQVIMRAIQELMTENKASVTTLGYGTESFSEVEPQLRYALDELSQVSEERDQMAQRCLELDMQVMLLQEEKSSLHSENEKLQERLREAEEALDDTATGSGQRYKELLKKLDSIQNELFKTETARDDYRLKVEYLESQLEELQGRQEELQRRADESQVLKDEVDVLRESAERVAKYEAVVETYKKKLEEYTDLKRQVKILEEKNTDYVQRYMELEEENKKIGTWKPQVEMYKKQVSELHQKLSEETKKADRADFENKKIQDKLTFLQREKERLIAERDSLKETNEELKCTQLQLRRGSAGLPSETDSVEMVSPEIKEKLLRLQHENRMLKMNQGEVNEEQIPVLKAMIDDQNQRVSELQTSNRLANQRILELESQLEDTQGQLRGASASVGSEGANEMWQHLAQLKAEKERQTAKVEEAEALVEEYGQKVAILQQTLQRKDAEMLAMEERYKKHIEKAKSVIKSLDPQQNPGAVPEVSVLRSQLLEKEKVIENMENESEKKKEIRDVEEKLISTAFYNFGLQLHRQAVEQRLSQLTRDQSFLSRQRQASGRRTGLGVNSSEYSDF